MMHFLFFLLTPILVSADNLFTKDLDVYGIAQDDLSSEPGFIFADLFGSNMDPASSDYEVHLDGTFGLGSFNVVIDDCSSRTSEWTSKLRSRQQCNNPSTPALKMPSFATEGSPSIADEGKPRCKDGETHLCCTGNEVAFWNGLRSIVSDCVECQFSLSFCTPRTRSKSPLPKKIGDSRTST